MIKMYVKFAFRNLMRRKGYAVLNIGGLAVGITCCLLIGLYVMQELSYDGHHKNSGRIFRMTFQLEQGQNIYREASIPFPASAALSASFPEIEAAGRLYRDVDPPILQVGDKSFAEPRFYFADPEILDILTIPLLRGETSVLQDPSSILVSKSTAEKYFGSVDPIGQVIRMVGMGEFRVGGIIKDSPPTSHIHFDFIAPMAFQLAVWERQTGQEGAEKKWFWTGAWTYVMLDEGSDPARVTAKLPDFVARHFPERTRKDVTLDLQPLRDIHLHSRLDNEIEPTGSFVYVFVFGSIAVAVLLIACINFVNLTTAEAVNRARELGVRKIVGAARGHMIAQVLCESMLSSLLAAVITIGMFEVAAKGFEELMGSPLALSIWNAGTMASILLVSGAVGALSGVYPAFYLSRIQPLSILKKTEKFRFGGGSFRQVLVISQFTVSITLLIGISVIQRQLDFFGTRSLGFDKDHVMIVKGQPEVDRKWDTFKQAISSTATVGGVTRMSNPPGEGAFVYRFVPEGGSMEKPENLPLLLIDQDFTQTLGVDVVSGRPMSREFPSDPTEGFWINETAARQLGWQGHAVGKKLDLFAAGRNEIGKRGRVLGVIGDYHFESLHHAVKPLVLTYSSFGMSHYAIRVTGGGTREAIADLETTWKEFCPEKPLEFSFLDQRLQSLYRSEQDASALVRAFSVIAIIVSCLGLYGLSIHTAEKRTKEIGIRKTLGATVRQIFVLLSVGFLKPVLIANMFAWPLAYMAASRWLEQFAYRVSVSPVDLLLGTIGAFLITLLTIMSQTWSAATANPVNALKYE